MVELGGKIPRFQVRNDVFAKIGDHRLDVIREFPRAGLDVIAGHGYAIHQVGRVNAGIELALVAVFEPLAGFLVGALGESLVVRAVGGGGGLWFGCG